MKNYKKPYIIFAVSLSLIEIFIGIPRSFSVTEIVVGLALFLMLYVPGLIYFISLENRAWNKIIEKFYKSKKIKGQVFMRIKFTPQSVDITQQSIKILFNNLIAETFQSVV